MRRQPAPVIVLGLNAFGHDAAAVLLVDGEIVFASSQERFDRVRHSAAYPREAAAAALAAAGLVPGDVDAIAFPWTRSMARGRKAWHVLRRLPRSRAYFRDPPDSLLPARAGYLRAMRGLEDQLRSGLHGAGPSHPPPRGARGFRRARVARRHGRRPDRRRHGRVDDGRHMARAGASPRAPDGGGLPAQPGQGLRGGHAVARIRAGERRGQDHGAGRVRLGELRALPRRLQTCPRVVSACTVSDPHTHVRIPLGRGPALRRFVPARPRTGSGRGCRAAAGRRRRGPRRPGRDRGLRTRRGVGRTNRCARATRTSHSASRPRWRPGPASRPRTYAPRPMRAISARRAACSSTVR